MRALTIALASAAALFGGSAATAQIWVSPTGSNSNSGTFASPFLTIAHAASVASAGQTIFLTAGTFPSTQVILGTKDLAIRGAGPGSTIIEAGSAEVILPTGFTSSPVPTAHRGVFFVDGAARIDLRGFTIDCKNEMPASGRLHGIWFGSGADGTVDNVEIKNAQASVLNGAQGPAGIVVRGDATGDPCTVCIRSCKLSNWGKAGIVALFNADVAIAYCTVTGAGPVDNSGPSQQGIQISYGAVGDVDHNIVTDCYYLDPFAFAATGILLYNQGPDCRVEANSVARCEDSITVAQVPSLASVATLIQHNRTTAAYSRGVRIDDTIGVVVNNNVIHHFSSAPGMPPAWDNSGNTWTNNNFSDWTSNPYFIMPLVGTRDLTARNRCEEMGGRELVSVEGIPVDIVSGDLDGINALDFVTLNVSPTGLPSITVVRSDNINGGLYGTASQTFGTLLSVPIALATGDVDADGDLDLVAITADGSLFGTSENRLYVFANNGSGAFSQIYDVALAGAAPTDVATGDLDGSPGADVAVSFSGSVTNNRRAVALLNNGAGTGFASTTLFTSSTAVSRGIVIGPVDPTAARADVVVTAGDSFSGTARVYGNNGSGVLSLLTVVTVDPNPTDVATFDTEGDGQHELLVTCDASGVGSVAYVRNLLPASMPVQLLPTDASPVEVLVGNIASDNDPDTLRLDAIIVNRGGRSLTLLSDFTACGPSQGALCVRLGTGAVPVAAAIEDFNSDGRPDVFVCNGAARRVLTFTGRRTAREDLYGIGCAGQSGRLPLISPGNALGGAPVALSTNSFRFELKNARPLSQASLLLSQTPASSLTACSLMVGSPFFTFAPVLTSTSGTASQVLPDVIDVSLITVYAQWAVFDPFGGATTPFSSSSLTQGMKVRFGAY